jgi:predicted CXXCH cytochrome family protein
LADFLQAIGRICWAAAFVWALPLAAASAFSHKVHLAQKIDCVVCHSAAPASTKVVDNLLPQRAVCLGCHEENTIPSIKTPRESAVSKFNHQLHVKMGNVAAVIARAIDNKTYLSPPGDARKYLDTKHPCTGCHRALQHSDAVTEAAFPRMADCLVCHNKIDPPFTCTKCHEDGAQLKPADHTADWIDAHSAGKIKDKTGCAVCHGRRFTCLGCH